MEDIFPHTTNNSTSSSSSSSSGSSNHSNNGKDIKNGNIRNIGIFEVTEVVPDCLIARVRGLPRGRNTGRPCALSLGFRV